MPAHGRLELASICLRQLRRTCDALTVNGIEATAVVVADDENLDAARALGFGTVERDNQFVSRRFNDGIEMACGRPLPPASPEPTHGLYEVTGSREYRGHPHGTQFEAALDRNAERRAIARRDIRLIDRVAPTLLPGSWTFPDGWDPDRAADFVMPIGSDDFIDWRILNPATMPTPNEIVGFQHISFVREDGRELTKTFLSYTGGSGMRIYPRGLLEKVAFRPADEDRERGCDTSIITNVLAADPTVRVMHVATDPRQLVDWKTGGGQLNEYEQVRRRHCRNSDVSDDPFEDLAGFFPEEALSEMEALYAHTNHRGAGRLLIR